MFLGKEYTVKIQAWFNGMKDQAGFSQYQIFINDPPSKLVPSATCALNKEVGDAMDVSFQAFCRGFTDTDMPLTYQYFYHLNKTYRPLTTTSMPQTDFFMLPGGVDKVKAIVTDAFGAEAKPIYMRVKVKVFAFKISFHYFAFYNDVNVIQHLILKTCLALSTFLCLLQKDGTNRKCRVI